MLKKWRILLEASSTIDCCCCSAEAWWQVWGVFERWWQQQTCGDSEQDGNWFDLIWLIEHDDCTHKMQACGWQSILVFVLVFVFVFVTIHVWVLNDMKTYKMKNEMSCVDIDWNGIAMRGGRKTQMATEFTPSTNRCLLFGLSVCSCFLIESVFVCDWQTRTERCQQLHIIDFSMTSAMWQLRECCKLCRFDEHMQTDCVVVFVVKCICACCDCDCIVIVLWLWGRRNTTNARALTHTKKDWHGDWCLCEALQLAWWWSQT